MFIGNTDRYAELLEWLKGGVESVCIVAGPTGCGKTYGIHTAALETNKLVTVLDTATCLNGKDFKDKYTKTTQSNVIAQFTKVKEGDRLIFVDELEALLMIDRMFLSNLKNLPSSIKVIIAATPEAAKRVLIPHRLIRLDVASVNDIIEFLKSKIVVNRKKNCKLLKEIGIACNGNLTSALRAVTSLSAHSDQHANSNNETDKDNFPDIGEVYRDTSKALTVLSADPWLNTLRFHENLVSEMKQRKVSSPNTRLSKEFVYTSIMCDLCNWDVMMKSDHTDYAMQFIAQSAKQLDNLALKKAASAPQTQFTRLINQLSVRKKGIVSLYGENGGFPWHHVGSFEKSQAGQLYKTQSKKTQSVKPTKNNKP